MNDNPMDQSRANELMQLAIDQGKMSVSEEGKLSPKVGAVLCKDGKILGSSFRGQFGEGDHAEYTLFEKTLNGKDVSGAVLFTTLEPCTKRNQHKPCSEWIIEKRISHVYVGQLDPNPKIYNNGCKKLKDASIEVSYFPKQLRHAILQDNFDFIEQFNANPNLSSKASFDYTNNSGIYTIGNNDMIFETKWSSANPQIIHAYVDPPSIKSIAIADGNTEIEEIIDASIYNSSSRSRTIKTGQILVLENINDYWAALKILDVQYNQNENSRNELSFQFRILPDRTSNFSSLQ